LLFVVCFLWKLEILDKFKKWFWLLTMSTSLLGQILVMKKILYLQKKRKGVYTCTVYVSLGTQRRRRTPICLFLTMRALSLTKD
jgi:hypothetical protein